MSAVQVNQPVAITSTQIMMMRGNTWSSGTCDCCEDCSVCCCAFWCFPCFQCQTVSNFGECLCLPLMDPTCMGYVGCSGACPPISMAMRAAVRERYNIEGSICCDCCILYWCYSCSWCQMAREIKKRKQPFNIVTAQTTTMQVPLQMHQQMPQQMPQSYSYGIVQQPM
ncbi:cornifelin homolog A-like [Pleurodeles waltl]|uniref:cornifelin homolog A-like n=1 Tax=Pleurodeles waltl TaxID=8319 RepID=UPI00370979D9